MRSTFHPLQQIESSVILPYGIIATSNTTGPVRATQPSYFTPESVLKGRVGALSRKFGAAEKDEGDLAVDDIPIGNVELRSLA
jgi:hypothetical protein